MVSHSVTTPTLSFKLTARNVLLVRKHEEKRVAHFPVLDDAREFGAGLVHAVAVVAVDDKDESLRAGKVVAPERTNLVLAADVPHVELGVLVRDRLDVEADCGNRLDVLVELELVEDGCGRDGVLATRIPVFRRGSETHSSCRRRQGRASATAFLWSQRFWP